MDFFDKFLQDYFAKKFEQESVPHERVIIEDEAPGEPKPNEYYNYINHI